MTRRFPRPTFGDLTNWVWDLAYRRGGIRSTSLTARRFARFGDASVIAFPPSALFGEHRVEIGEQCVIGPNASISASMPAWAHERGDPIISIGDRCSLGKGVGIVGHERIVLEADIWTGHYVYITDQNHGYEDIAVPIGTQLWKNAPVRIGAGSWLGHSCVVLPGADIGEHVVVAAGAVVGGTVPDNCVVGGIPGRVLRHHDGDEWRSGPPS